MLMTTLAGIKDTDIKPLKFEPYGYKPMEYERWIFEVDIIFQEGIGPHSGHLSSLFELYGY